MVLFIPIIRTELALYVSLHLGHIPASLYKPVRYHNRDYVCLLTQAQNLNLCPIESLSLYLMTERKGGKQSFLSKRPDCFRILLFSFCILVGHSFLSALSPFLLLYSPKVVIMKLITHAAAAKPDIIPVSGIIKWQPLGFSYRSQTVVPFLLIPGNTA